MNNTLVFSITTNLILGLENASKRLQQHYQAELINCLVEQPFASDDNTIKVVPREEEYISLAVIDASEVDKEWNNSDRDALMEQRYLKMRSIDIEHIVQSDDQVVIVRGVAGIGKTTLIDMFTRKTTLIDMFTLKWAKGEILKEEKIDFLFRFTCSGLNRISEKMSLEELFKEQFPEIFSFVSIEELGWISSRILIVVDGLDELQGIYAKEMDENCSPEIDLTRLTLVYNMINRNGSFLKNHKSIICGRPKACEFIKCKLAKSKNIVKSIEVCGFSSENVQKYITQFFYYDKDTSKADRVRRNVNNSNDLAVMSSVPVFLWIICNIYSEDLVTYDVQSKTELYLYTCLVFMRNHMRTISSLLFEDLFDLVNNQEFLKILKILATLSLQTYINHKVLFDEEDVQNLKCSVHLEQTGSSRIFVQSLLEFNQKYQALSFQLRTG